jgi:hypothetical protein
MPPNLTADEIAQLKKEQAKALSASETFANAVAAQNARALELAKVDSAFKKFFDYYNADIIERYNSERRLINGVYVTDPVTEADVLNAASLQGGRLQPTLPATDVIRITQFDGTPTATDSSYELTKLADQAQTEDRLVNGFGGTTPSASIVTATAVTSGSTTLQLTDPTTTYSLSPGAIYVVKTMSDLAVIRIDTFVMQVSPAPPPYIANCNITVIVPPAGSISSGVSLEAFTGFTNAERTAKTTTDPQMQPLMNYLIAELQTRINARITNMNSQLVQIAANQDPDAVAELAQATTDVNASKTYLTNYLITTIISNAGLTALSGERVARTTQANTRVAQIIVGFTGRTLNYYNERYNAANNRANTSRGSLRLQKNAEQVAGASAGYASTLADQAAAIGSILP